MAKTKIKQVLPSLKEKKRYLVYEIISKEPVKNGNLISKSILQNILSFMGELNAAKAGIRLFQDCWNPKTNKGIIRTGHKYADEVKTALSMISQINGNEIIIKTIGVSGTMAAAKQKFMTSN